MLMPAELAEAYAFDFLLFVAKAAKPPHADWFGRMAAFAKSGLTVLRAVLLKRDDYIDHLVALRDRDALGIEPQGHGG